MLTERSPAPRQPLRFLMTGLTLCASMETVQAADMTGMDHGSHSMNDMTPMQDDLQPMQPLQVAPSESRTPIPPITAADRAAVYTSHAGHQVHDDAINSFFLAEKFEWQNADEGSALAWDLSGWIGGDIDRLWLRSEGERINGKTHEAEVQALWGHAISPWWDLVGGVRQDFKPDESQTWAAFGIQGMALYNFEAQATAFIGEAGQTAARLEGDYDVLLTNRLILQPTVELNLYGKDDPQRGIGAGLSNTEFGLRLRYEIRREFAPYIGVNWNRIYGKTADYARDDGQDRSEARLVLGVRMWF